MTRNPQRGLSPASTSSRLGRASGTACVHHLTNFRHADGSTLSTSVSAVSSTINLPKALTSVARFADARLVLEQFEQMDRAQGGAKPVDEPGAAQAVAVAPNAESVTSDRLGPERLPLAERAEVLAMVKALLVALPPGPSRARELGQVLVHELCEGEMRSVRTVG